MEFELCRREVITPFERHEKVVEALKSRRIVILRVQDVKTSFYVFKGVKRDYILIPCRWCSCTDFIMNTIRRGIAKPCYHLATLAIALGSGKFVEIDVDFQSVKNIILEIAGEGISTTLRRILAEHFREVHQ